MKPVWSRLLIAAFHVSLAGSVGAKFLIEREIYPRAWVETIPFDPELPIRGRYLRLSVILPSSATTHWNEGHADMRVRLVIDDHHVTASPDKNGGGLLAKQRPCRAGLCWLLIEPVAFFLPEHVADPLASYPGARVWVEATIPPAGPPRPTRLGVSVNENFQVLAIN